MNAYQHLVNMCSPALVKANEESRRYDVDGISARLQYIMAQGRSGKGRLHSYNINGTQGHNFYRVINVGAPTTVVFMAHHDVVNLRSQNCNDNTASCCQLLQLARRFSRNRKQLKHNVVVAWVDHEEVCSTTLAGSSQLAKQIKAGEFGTVIGVYNLELTACGSFYWYSNERATNDMVQTLKQSNFESVRCPLNDAVHMRAQGVGAVCIGSFRAEDREIVVNQKRCGCELWTSCHKNDDSYDNWADYHEMRKFNNVLFNLVNEMPEQCVDVVFSHKDYVEPPPRIYKVKPKAPVSRPSHKYVENNVRDSYPDHECPDCFLRIPLHVQEGDECKDCGHVFTTYRPVDDSVIEGETIPLAFNDPTAMMDF